MSFRDTPLTRNCDVVDVMGRRIATSRARQKPEEDTLVENWQPFQINGRRVTPCRLQVNVIDQDPHMPEINGVPIDEPGARINWVGHVYLSVKMALQEDAPDVPTIDPNVKPIIEPVSRGDKLEIIYNGAGTPSPTASINGDGWVSWKIGRIQNTSPRIENYLRYFTGHDERWNGYNVENGPIYKKGTFYPGPPKEWGLAFVSDRKFTFFNQIPTGEDPNFTFSQDFFSGEDFNRMTVGVGGGQYSVPTFIVLTEEIWES